MTTIDEQSWANKVHEQLQESHRANRDLEAQRDALRDRLVAEQQAKEAALQAHAEISDQHEGAKRLAAEKSEKAAQAELLQTELAAAKSEIAELVERVGGLTRGVDEAEAKAAALEIDLGNERSARAEAEAKAAANEQDADKFRALSEALSLTNS